MALIVLGSVATPVSAGPQVDATQGSTSTGTADTGSVHGETIRDRNDAASDASAVIHEQITMDRTPSEPGAVDVTIEYDVPSSVDELDTTVSLLQYDAVTVRSTENFESEAGGTFAWSGDSETASITLRMRVSEDVRREGSFGVERDDWAFSYLPTPYTSWHYVGEQPELETTTTVAGTGYAGTYYALDGATSVQTPSVDGVSLSIVTAPGGNPEYDYDEAIAAYRVANRELVGGNYLNESGIFVLPDDATHDRSALGTTWGESFWILDEHSSLDTVDNTFLHETVHTRLKFYGEDSSEWLTEAIAEYYGRVLTMNTNHASWSQFETALEVDDARIRSSTLAKSKTWSSAYVPYEKGALVLAALDAQIRERTGGVKTLQDVIAYRFSDDDPYGDLATYENFSRAVVDVTNDESMQEWLDAYVAGDATPSVPSDPTRFVLNDSMDSDGDGIPNGEEGSTNPFDDDTDGDGIDDGRDDYPNDDTRYDDGEDDTTAITTTTTTSPTATSTATTAPRTTSPGTEDAEASESGGAGFGDDSTDATRPTPTSADTDGAAAVDSSTETDAGSPTATGGEDVAFPTPGFGVLLSALSVTAALVIFARRRSTH